MKLPFSDTFFDYQDNDVLTVMTGCLADPENPENPKIGRCDPRNPENPENSSLFQAMTLNFLCFECIFSHLGIWNVKIFSNHGGYSTSLDC